MEECGHTNGKLGSTTQTNGVALGSVVATVPVA
jgi:hypothetical protein